MKASIGKTRNCDVIVTTISAHSRNSVMEVIKRNAKNWNIWVQLELVNICAKTWAPRQKPDGCHLGPESGSRCSEFGRF